MQINQVNQSNQSFSARLYEPSSGKLHTLVETTPLKKTMRDVSSVLALKVPNEDAVIIEAKKGASVQNGVLPVEIFYGRFKAGLTGVLDSVVDAGKSADDNFKVIINKLSEIYPELLSKDGAQTAASFNKTIAKSDNRK